MEWAPDWEHRVDFMLRNGLLVRVEGMVVDDLVAVYLSAYDAMLPRSNAARGFRLHVSLGYAQCYCAELLEAVAAHFNARWAGRELVLNIIEFRGSAAYIDPEPLFDEEFRFLHSIGNYGTRPLHISL